MSAPIQLAAVPDPHLDFHDYPFDSQSLVLRITNPRMTREQVIYLSTLSLQHSQTRPFPMNFVFPWSVHQGLIPIQSQV